MFAWLWEVNFSKFFVFTGQFTIENNWDLFAARVTLLNGEGKVVKEAPTQMCKHMFGAVGIVGGVVLYDAEGSCCSSCANPDSVGSWTLCVCTA